MQIFLEQFTASLSYLTLQAGPSNMRAEQPTNQSWPGKTPIQPRPEEWPLKAAPKEEAKRRWCHQLQRHWTLSSLLLFLNKKIISAFYVVGDNHFLNFFCFSTVFSISRLFSHFSVLSTVYFQFQSSRGGRAV